MSIESRTGTLSELISVNNTLTEWDEHFSEGYFKDSLEGKQSLIVIGVVDNQPAGFIAGYKENEAFKRWVSGVDPKYRGLGIYKGMHDFCERSVADMGLEKILSDVAMRGDTMIKLNLDLGYKIASVEPIQIGSDLANSRIFFEKQIK